jgi:hypothetical protein
MAERDPGWSSELDLVRELLFPHLPPERGRELVHAAEEGQLDERRWERIEAIARFEDALATSGR